MSDLRRAMVRGFVLLKVVMGAIFALSSRAQGLRSRLDKSMITSRVRGQWYRRVREHGKWSWLSAARLHKGFTKLIWKGISDSLVQVNNYTRDKFIQRTRKISFSVCKFEMKTTIKIF